MGLIHFYRTPGASTAATETLLQQVRNRIFTGVETIESEICFNIEAAEPLDAGELTALTWLLSETFEPDRFRRDSFLTGDGEILEVGPRLNFSTAFSTNAVSICHACDLDKVSRIERSRRYLLHTSTGLSDEHRAAFFALVHDRMTECPYPEPLDSFATGIEPAAVLRVPVLEDGRAALERLNAEMGLAFDDWDLDYYTGLFRDDMCRDPTNVECFDVAQSNSEHSRHWFFKGRLIIDGREVPDDLMSLVRAVVG